MKYQGFKKIQIRPGNMLYPLPVVLVSCDTQPRDHNLLTIAWTGTVCSDPPMLSISVRPERYSHDLIKKAGEFVVNMPSKEMLRIVDFCGMKSGRDLNKWEALKIEKYPSEVIQTPQVKDCPVSLECKVDKVLKLGSHDCFIAEVVSVSVHPRLVDSRGRHHLDKAGLFVYNHGAYQLVDKVIGTYGYSIKRLG
jgi:flavin reductase (DIM6/NTAB) family NADH-FMN oxidoreductase RutF